MIPPVSIQQTTPLGPAAPSAQGAGRVSRSGQDTADKQKTGGTGYEEEVRLSPEARRLSASQADSSAVKPTDNESGLQMSSGELAQLQQLKSRDSEVRTHERAHLSAAGSYAQGAPSFTYQRGPDGNNYAIGGQVSIDIGKEPTPEETITKMQTVRRAALAPANPSANDRYIAAQASAKEMQARQQLSMENQDDLPSDELAPMEKAVGEDRPGSSHEISAANKNGPANIDQKILRAIQAYSY